MSQMPHDDPEFPMLEGPFESPRPNQTSADDAPCAERMTRAELADLLERVAPLVRSGDSAEGRIQYLLPDEGPWDDVMVSVAVRSGNLGGTGFWHVITGGQDMDSLLAELDRKGRP